MLIYFYFCWLAVNTDMLAISTVLEVTEYDSNRTEIYIKQTNMLNLSTEGKHLTTKKKLAWPFYMFCFLLQSNFTSIFSYGLNSNTLKKRRKCIPNSGWQTSGVETQGTWDSQAQDVAWYTEIGLLERNKNGSRESVSGHTERKLEGNERGGEASKWNICKNFLRTLSLNFIGERKKS